jgi:4-hydroxymandelate oxidase
MDRRFFSQLMALSAGAFGVWPTSARGAQPADAAEGGPGSPPKPAGDRGPAAAARDAAAPPNAAAARNAAARNDAARNAAVRPVNVADYQELARTALPVATYDYIATGSTDEVTLRDNIAAFQRIRLLPPLLTGVASVATATTVLKQPIAAPIMLAPVAGQSLYHADGGLASARAASAVGTIMGVSSSIGHSVEELAAAAPGPKWFQLYVPKDRGVAKRLVERAQLAGFKAIVLTVDLGERKDADRRHRFALPPAVLRKNLRDAGFEIPDRMTYEQMMAFNDDAWDLTLSWKSFDWLRSITKLPLVIKGVLRPEDAKQAVDLGLDGIVVSNHGGRRLDGVPASIDQLARIVDVVQGRAEVVLDSGVRRGTDVLKALAFGARAVMIGRPYAWALAADGEAGVKHVWELLREELVSAMLACGCPNVASINRSLLLA